MSGKPGVPTELLTSEVVEIMREAIVVATLRPLGGGPAKGEFEITGDIISPLDVKWEALDEDYEDPFFLKDKGSQ